MKRMIALLAAAMFLVVFAGTALAAVAGGPGDFLDPARLVGETGRLVSAEWPFVDPLTGEEDVYAAYAYKGVPDPEAFAASYCERMLGDYGWEVTPETVSDLPCLVFGPEDGHNFLFYDYDGGMLLLTPARYGFEPLGLVYVTPEPTPVPTATPAPEQTDAAGQAATPTPAPTVEGEWRMVEVEVKCPSCWGLGTCRICHGMGYTTLYGQRTDCPKECVACDGQGYYIQWEYHFFPKGSDRWIY